MAVKYRLQFQNLDLSNVVVTLESDDYTGSIVDIIGVGGESYSKTINGSDSQPHDKHVITTSASIKAYTNLIDVDDLQMSSDREWKVTVTIGGLTDFVGFLIPDGIQKTLKGAGNVVHLNATCGLSLLDGLKFDWSKISNLDVGALTHESFTVDNRSPIQYIRAILVQLNNALPINWSTSIKCDEYPTRDVFAGSLSWANGVFLNELATFENIDCMWLLENMCKSLKLWVAQRGGEWYFINLEDLVRLNGSLSVNRITGGFGVKTSTISTVDFNINLDDKQINDDAYTYYKNALGKSRVAYNHSQLKNILPNGNFDYVESNNTLTGWTFSSGLAGVGFATAKPSIIDRTGSSAELEYASGDLGSEGVFSLTHPLNIDGNVLYKDMRFGFVMFPISGFPVDENGYIDWLQFPFKISVKYTILQSSTIKNFYLNEFGYWSDKNVAPNQSIVNSFIQDMGSYDRLAVNFNPTARFFVGDRFNLSFNRGGIIEVHQVVFTENMTVEDGLDFLSTKIPNSARMTSPPNQWYVQPIDSVFYSVSMDKADNYYKYIFPELQQMKPNIDVGKWEFQSKGNSGGIIIPDPSSLYDKDTLAGKLTIEFYVKAGQKYRLDDVWIELNDNQDVFELVTNEDNTMEKFEMGISSSFSGFMMSSYMANYGEANKMMNFTDYSGTSKRLTELYGRGIMNWRYTPRMIYQGSFKHTAISPFSLLEIDSRKFVPLGYEHNVNTGRILNTKLFEAKLESPTIVVGHNNFNDNSNGANYGSGGGYSGGGGGGGGSQSLQDTLDIGNIGDDMIITDSLRIPTTAPTTPQAGNIWVGSNGVNPSPIGMDLNDLDDVDITTPTNNQVLTYNSTTNKWENKTGSSGGSQSLQDTLDIGNTTSTGIEFTSYGNTNGLIFKDNVKVYQLASLPGTLIFDATQLGVNGYLASNLLTGTGDRNVVADSQGRLKIGGSSGSGTVTSVAMSVPTGFSVSGSPITSSGTLALSFASGYSLPSNSQQSTWSNKQDALIAGSGISIVGNTISATGSGGGGSVTSVGLTMPSAFSVSGSPITSSGTLSVTLNSGYKIPTTTEWDGKVSVAGNVSITGDKDFIGSLLYNGEEVATLQDLSTVFRYKGSVATFSGLPTSGNVIGDTWNVNDTGKNYAWNGTAWDDLGGNVDLSNYYTKAQVDALIPSSLKQSQWDTAYSERHTHSNKANLDTINQNLSTTSNVQFNSVNATASMQIPTVAPSVINNGNIWVGTSGTSASQVVGSLVTALTSKTSSFSISTSDGNNYIQANLSVDGNCTINSAVPLMSVFIEQSGSGKVTFVAGSGVTIRKIATRTGRTIGQYNVVEVFYKTATEVILKGEYE